jgi:RNA polymerase sigma factor (sigma-70 family)
LLTFIELSDIISLAKNIGLHYSQKPSFVRRSDHGIETLFALDKLPVWVADKRLLPRHLRGVGDNSRQVQKLRLALRAAMETRLGAAQRHCLLLHYCESKTKTEIGELLGVGSSTVCKTLKAAEKAVREYVEIYMAAYERARRDILRDDDEYGDIRGEIDERNDRQHHRYD